MVTNVFICIEYPIQSKGQNYVSITFLKVFNSNHKYILDGVVNKKYLNKTILCGMK